MKVTALDKELAARFPKPNPSDIWGFGKSAGDAKISPTQLDRLLKLNLIRLSDRGLGVCGGAVNSPGVGKGWTRHHTGFVQV